MKPDIKGLEKLAAHLRQVPRKEFEVDTWFDETPCGTKACIAGHAALLFPSRLKRVMYEEWENSKYYEVTNRKTGTIDEIAFADAFRIDREDAIDLCLMHPNENSTPKKAAKAVDKLVAKLTKEMKVK